MRQREVEKLLIFPTSMRHGAVLPAEMIITEIIIELNIFAFLKFGQENLAKWAFTLLVLNFSKWHEMSSEALAKDKTFREIANKS